MFIPRLFGFSVCFRPRSFSSKAAGHIGMLWLLCLLQGLTAGSVMAEPLPIFADPAMQSCMESLAAENNWSSAEEVQELSCVNQGVRDLSGIEGLINLNSVDLSHNFLQDIYPLHQLPSLQRLVLSGNSGIDFGQVEFVLQHLATVTHLGLGDILIPQLQDLPLRSPQQLLELDLRNTGIVDLEPLRAFLSLQKLSLGDNGITNIIALESLTQLTAVDLRNNSLHDVDPLRMLPAIEDLILSGNPGIDFAQVQFLLQHWPMMARLAVADIAMDDLSRLHLPNLKQLVALDISHTGISDLEPLRYFSALQRLNASDNHIEFIGPLDSLNQLAEVNLSGNRVMDVFPLVMRPNRELLTSVNLANNRLHDIHPLTMLPNLVELDLTGNRSLHWDQVRTLLENMPGARRLGLGGLRVGDLMQLPLAQLQELVELNLANTQLSDISALRDLVRIERLDLSDNTLTHVAALSGMANLFSLDLSNNQLTDLYPLHFLQNLREIRLSGNSGIPFSRVKEVLQAQHHVTHLGLADIAIGDLSLLHLNRPEQLLELDISHTGLFDIEPLRHFRNLRALDLSDNAISHVAPLDHLLQLSSVDLGNNQLSDIFPLTMLSKLRQVVLSGNSDIEFSHVSYLLEQLQNIHHLGLADIVIDDLARLVLQHPESLQVLDLGNTGIRDIEPLRVYTQLRTLNLRDNAVDAVWALDSLTQLTAINLSGNRIVDIYPLVMRPQPTLLSSINLANNPLLDISPLTMLSNLNELILSDNPRLPLTQVHDVLASNSGLQRVGLRGIAIGDLTRLPLSQLAAVRELDLANAGLNNIDPLADLVYLETLDLSGNALVELYPLSNLFHLVALNLNHNKINDIHPIIPLPNLREIFLSGNSDIQSAQVMSLLQSLPVVTRLGLGDIALGDLTQLTLNAPWRLRELDVSNTGVEGIEALHYFEGLERLDLSNNAVVNLLPLGHLRQLLAVNLSNNQIGDIFPLETLPNLREINLSGNSDIDFMQVKFMLEQFPRVTRLGLAHIAVTDLMQLSLHRPRLLVELDLSHTGIADIEPLRQFENLRALDVSGNAIEFIGAVDSLRQLASLNLGDNRIREVYPLFMLAGQGTLEHINLWGNNTIECVVLDDLESVYPQGVVVRPATCVVGAPPTLQLLSPASGETVSLGESVWLDAIGKDFEDGNLSAQIQWHSNVQGPLGVGTGLAVQLAVGTHSIRATLTDSDENSVSIEVEVVVVAAEYCRSQGMNAHYEWIDAVAVNAQSHPSGANAGYGNFTGETPFQLGRGAHTLVLTPGFGEGSYHEDWSVWIDLNQDGQFDAQEKVFAGSSASVINGSFSIPESALVGETRMRVAMKWGGPASPCESFSWGEVEDYRVSIQ